jgi:hypothetical protein
MLNQDFIFAVQDLVVPCAGGLSPATLSDFVVRARLPGLKSRCHHLLACDLRHSLSVSVTRFPPFGNKNNCVSFLAAGRDDIRVG